MSHLRPQTGIEGALYDLVARGKKDTFFLRDEKTSENLFDSRYEPIPASLPELRLIVPRNRVMFGGTCEFEIETAGDLLIEPTLLINLPSWLPPPFSSQNKNTLIQSSGVSYGYVSGIAYFLFEKIQFYQDTLLLQEYSGDSLFALRHLRGSYNSAFLEDALTGVHDGSDLSIQRAATPRQLRLRLPLPFCQHADEGGIPLYATKSQQFRLKLTLRKLEDLIESSDQIDTRKPSPFGKTFTQTLASTAQQSFLALDRYSVGDPTIYLENRQIYLEQPQQQPQPQEQNATFSRLFENKATFAQADYAVANGTAKRLLDGRHPAEQIFWYFRTPATITTNRLWRFEPTTYNAIKLVIAGKDREQFWSSQVWEDIEQHAKQERYSGRAIGSANWSYGITHAERAPKEYLPTGTVNFTSADRPWFYVNLTPLQNGQTMSELTVVVDAYGLYSVQDGRGGLRYAN